MVLNFTHMMIKTHYIEKRGLRRFFLSAFIFLIWQGAAWAQCPNSGRFYDRLYAYDSMEVVYTNVRNDYNKMDVFVPKGDSGTRRPLLLLAHGGGFTSGNKNTDAAVNHLCRTFAQRGFVTASIQYRLTSAFNLIDSVVMMKTVLYAIYDAKAAVRYFVKDAATTNQFKVDTQLIFIGGSSAGAVLSIHYAYLDELNEVPSTLIDTIVARGGMEGDAGNPGYSSKVKAIIAMAGGINKTWWIGAQEEPALLIHGDQDRTVPYYFDQVYRLPPYNNFTLVTLYGSGSIDTALNNRGIPHQLKTYWGYDHTPWDTSQSLRADIDTIARDFFYDILCNELALHSREPLKNETLFSVYPHPAANELIVKTHHSSVASIAIYNYIGQAVRQERVQTPSSGFTLTVADLPNGIYSICAVDKRGEVLEHKKIVITR
jgi:acetyl esterase/lipase